MKKLVIIAKGLFQQLVNWFGNINLLSFSIVSLILVLINYFPLINELGYYFDDWPQIYSWSVRGVEGIKELWIADNRAFASWIHLALFPLLGTKPLGWHILLALLRWITAIQVWAIFCKIWPKQKVNITAAALLFAIYPLFKQQTCGLMFTTIWVCFVLFLASVWIMISTVPMKKWMIPLILLGLGIDLLSILSYEYYLGLEFLRPLLLFLIINKQSIPKSRKLFQTIIYSIPWLIISFGFLIWRAFINKSAFRSVSIFSNLASSPFQTILDLIETTIKDTIQIVVSVWYQTFSPSLFDLTIPSEIVSWGLFLLVFVATAFYFITINKKNIHQEEDKKHINLIILIVGLLFVIFGAAPGWAIGSSVSNPNNNLSDRFGIASMFGASLSLIGLIGIVVKPSKLKMLVIVALLIGLATGSNFRNTNDYRWSAIYQTRLYNQLYWRAPYIKPDTAILSANELSAKMGRYPNSFAINTMYPSSNPMPEVDYWVYTIQTNFQNNSHDLDKGIALTNQKWYTEFSSISTDSLVVYWIYSDPSCLWVLDENDRYNPFISDDAKTALGASNLSRIVDLETPGYPPVDIFGSELPHGWCYYFEKADLAKQLNQWDKIPELYEEATSLGFNTNYAPELTPYIFGYALTGNLDKAVELTNISKTMAEKMKPYLCDQWTAIKNLSNSSQEIIDVYEKEMADLQCGI